MKLRELYLECKPDLPEKQAIELKTLIEKYGVEPSRFKDVTVG